MKKDGYYVTISPLRGEKAKKIFISGTKIKFLKFLTFLFLFFLPFLIYSIYYLYSNIYNYMLLKERVRKYEKELDKVKLLEKKMEDLVAYAKKVNNMLGLQKEDLKNFSISPKNFPYIGENNYEKFILPVEGIISRDFSKEHPGIDIVAPAGTPVLACMDGYVIEAGFSDYFGFYVKLNHKGGFYSFYGHMRRVFVRRGEFVKKGGIIGEVGSTGRSTGPHLHFEIIKNGKPINPFLFSFINVFERG